jgi:hypothetical protein
MIATDLNLSARVAAGTQCMQVFGCMLYPLTLLANMSVGTFGRSVCGVEKCSWCVEFSRRFNIIKMSQVQDSPWNALVSFFEPCDALLNVRLDENRKVPEL